MKGSFQSEKINVYHAIIWQLKCSHGLPRFAKIQASMGLLGKPLLSLATEEIAFIRLRFFPQNLTWVRTANSVLGALNNGSDLVVEYLDAELVWHTEISNLALPPADRQNLAIS